jgi:hypothetical protein
MSDLISRSSLLTEFQNPDLFNVTEKHLSLIINAPTFEAAEVKHGRWIAVPSSDQATGKAYKCSECENMRYGSYMPPYCQCCGARMDGSK